MPTLQQLKKIAKSHKINHVVQLLYNDIDIFENDHAILKGALQEVGGWS